MLLKALLQLGYSGRRGQGKGWSEVTGERGPECDPMIARGKKSQNIMDRSKTGKKTGQMGLCPAYWIFVVSLY